MIYNIFMCGFIPLLTIRWLASFGVTNQQKHGHVGRSAPASCPKARSARQRRLRVLLRNSPDGVISIF